MSIKSLTRLGLVALVAMAGIITLAGPGTPGFAANSNGHNVPHRSFFSEVLAAATETTGHVSGGGKATMTYDACVQTAWFSDLVGTGLGERPGCSTTEQSVVSFNVHAKVQADGSAVGHVRIDINGQWVKDSWYGIPQESIARQVVLLAEIVEGEPLPDGGIVLRGLTQEYDFDNWRNVLFSACDNQPYCNEPRTPFELRMGGSLGVGGMSLDWCEYPGPYALKVKSGNFNINTGSQASPLQSAEFAQSEGAASGCRQ